ncbi:hypothetical protein EJB05_57865, partial [Eragrostis curvula]
MAGGVNLEQDHDNEAGSGSLIRFQLSSPCNKREKRLKTRGQAITRNATISGKSNRNGQNLYNLSMLKCRNGQQYTMKTLQLPQHQNSLVFCFPTSGIRARLDRSDGRNSAAAAAAEDT